MKTCSKCGSPNDETLSRCARCGAKLPRAVDSDHPTDGRDDTPAVKNHMRLAIVATVLFIPFGVLAIVQAAQVNGWCAAGETDRARRASERATRWAHAGIITGLIVNPLLIIAARFA